MIKVRPRNEKSFEMHVYDFEPGRNERKKNTKSDTIKDLHQRQDIKCMAKKCGMAHRMIFLACTGRDYKLGTKS